MDGESRARGSHDLLLFGTRKLPQYRLCYGGRGLDCKGVHEHARRCRHVLGDSQPAGYQFNCKRTPSSMLLCARMSAHSLGEDPCGFEESSGEAELSIMIGLNRAE